MIKDWKGNARDTSVPALYRMLTGNHKKLRSEIYFIYGFVVLGRFVYNLCSSVQNHQIEYCYFFIAGRIPEH
jgi:hypothetical protein